MGSISIMEAESSKEQAHRAQVLTQLPLVYLSLSFVTVLFGMNVKEINGSPLPVWTVVVALTVTVGCTAGVFGPDICTKPSRGLELPHQLVLLSLYSLC